MKGFFYIVLTLALSSLLLVRSTSAQTQSHPLSEITPIDVNLNMTNATSVVFNITDLGWLYYSGGIVFAGTQGIPTTDIKDLAVTTSKIANNAVTAAKLASDLGLGWGNLTGYNLNVGWIGELGWSNLTSYPNGCGANQAVRIIGDTLTCIDVLTSETGDITDVLAGYGITVDNSGGPQPRVNLSSTAAGTGLSYSLGVLSSTGVLSATAGTGISVNASSGNILISNAGVTGAVAGTGISVNATTGGVLITNTGDTNAADDLTTSTNFGNVSSSDINVSGVYNSLNLQIGTGRITAADLTANLGLGWGNLTGYSLNQAWSGTLHGANITSGTVTATQLTADLGLGWGNLTAYPAACSAGFAVQTVGDTLTCVPIAGTPNVVNGSGTANYVPLWNGSSTLNSSVIYQSGGLVGINTNSPVRLLHVSNGNITVTNDTVARSDIYWDSTNNRLVIRVN